VNDDEEYRVSVYEEHVKYAEKQGPVWKIKSRNPD
jgi:hypothetical protein